MLNRTWRPFVEVVGADGLPSVATAGNVLRPSTTFKLSLRIPPTADPDACSEYLTKLLSKNPIQGAKVTVTADEPGGGWNAPELSPWLEKACANASNTFFKKPCVYMGEGGSIPFMGMLGEKFPEAQFMITGVLGPQSNAHGPNEFLHIPMGKKLTASVALVLQDHLNRDRSGKPAQKKPAQKKPAQKKPAQKKADKAKASKAKKPAKAKKKSAGKGKAKAR